MTLKSGDLVRNRYRIMHRLSDTSYRALDMSLRQSCLIKEFSGTTSERVTQLASLQHPRLPRVIDLAREGDQTLLVMDLVDGVSLSERLLQSNEPIQIETIRPWLIELSETLEYLHQQTPPIAHGDVLIDNVLVQPDGSTAFTDFSIYSRNPIEDIKGLGMIAGYLTTHTMPPVSAEQMKVILAGRADVMSQTALQMISGQVEQIDRSLRDRLTDSSLVSSALIEGAEPESDIIDTTGLASEPISTVPLDGQIFVEPSLEDASVGQSSGTPLMPWDQDEEGSDTVLWGERGSEPKAGDQPPADDPKTTPFESVSAYTPHQPTEVLNSPEAVSGVLQEVDAQAPLSAASTNPVSNNLQTDIPQYESRFDGDKDDEAEESGGFNWLWIIVGIMAGVILLCIACLGIGIYFAEDLESEPTPISSSSFADEDEPEPDFSLPDTPTKEAPIVVEETDEFTPGLDGAESEPVRTVDSTNNNDKNSNDGVNVPALDESDQSVVRNEAFGYQFVLPDQLVVAEEVDGSITLEASSGLDDQAIFLAVFPLSSDTTAESLMAELVLSAESEGGTVYGEAIPANFISRSNLTGLTITINLPPSEGATLSLLGQMYALENSEASVMIVSTAVPDQFQTVTDQLNGLLESLEIFTPEG